MNERLRTRLERLALPALLVLMVATTLSYLNPAPPPMPGAHGDKVAHLGVFLAHGLLVPWTGGGRRRHRWLLALVVVEAVLLEWLQQFVPNRTATWGDLSANSAGLFVGLLLGALSRHPGAAAPPD